MSTPKPPTKPVATPKVTASVASPTLATPKALVKRAVVASPPPALPTPHVAATPATRATTPVPPAHFAPTDLLDKDSDAYKRLKHRALAVNAAELAARPADPAKWRKSRLEPVEKYYLWNAQRGKCGRDECTKVLDDKTMTIEHVVPKSVMPSATWDIRNFTVLCSLCNAKKGARQVAGAATAREFHYQTMSAVAPQQAKWAGEK